ncbi:hypothetical protein CLV56_2271 [Mumia flava]|uniref:Uncharacterized protein n=1 Tax=Mumia flava TaxID=1348852 RepID=A0A0B2BVE1_9ACTN|nr:hypothetical protein [Mumia flava]PJJ58027.1 hypothetical protein CLV56_2271 [Mumia flava]
MLVGTAAASAASTGWKAVKQGNGQAEAKFVGYKKWYSRNDHHGGFRIKGQLKDLKNNDRAVKFQIKVVGYSPKVYNAPEDANRTIPDRIHHDPAMTITPCARIQTCERNVGPDDCSAWRKYSNPYYD